MANIQFQFRKGTSAEWASANPVLAIAEFGVETDTNKFKIGNGTSNWNALPYVLTPFPYTGSANISGSFSVTGPATFSDAISATLIGTASWANNATTASAATSLTFIPTTASFSVTASYITPENLPAIATTGSNIFNGSQTVSGSLIITNDLTVLGSSSIQYVSQSTLNIETNLITVNTSQPSSRFGGLAVIDSGSSPQLSGSLLFDSSKNQWLFIHQNQSVVTSSLLVMHAPTYNNVGNEISLTTNTIPKSLGKEHIGDSQITDDGTIVNIVNSLTVGNTINATAITGSFTGSFIGVATTASYVDYTNLVNTPALLSSSAQINLLTNVSASFATTASVALTAQSITNAVRFVSSSDQVLLTDDILICTNGFVTMSLPPANALAGLQYQVKNVGTGQISLLPSGSDTIDGYSIMTLEETNSMLGVISNGTTGWIIF